MGLWYHDPHLQAASPQQARKLEGCPSHCPQGSRLKGALVAVEQTSTISWYLRMFSYLLMICGLFGLAVGGVVIYGALADGAAAATGLPLSGALGGPAQPRFGRRGRLGVRVGTVLCHGRSASHVAHLQPVAHGDLRRHRRQPGEIGPIVRPLP